MAFTTILEAQTFAVNKTVERYNLEIQYALYTDLNDPLKVTRNALKNQIRVVQKDLDSANTYLNVNHNPPLYYSSSIFDEDQRVKTQWSNEKDVPGTVLFYLNSLPPGDVHDFQLIQGQNKLLLNQLAPLIAQQQKELVNLNKMSNDILPQKTVLINDARLDLDESEALANQIEAHNKVIQSTIDAIISPKDVPPALNSNDTQIRNTIQQSTEQKVGFEGQVDVEATVILRKRVLDAYYSATTPEEKSLAQTRLDYTLEAINPSVPITRNTVAYDPNRFFELSSDLNTLQSEALALQIQINDTTDPTQLAILNQLLVQKNKQILILSDMLAGFQDTTLTSSAFFGSFPLTQSPLPPNDTGMDYLIKGIQSSETDSFKNQRDMPQNSPGNDLVVDYKTGKSISRADALRTPEGRYVLATPPKSTTENIDELVSNQQATALKTHTTTVNHIDDNKLYITNEKNKNIEDIDKQIQEQRAKIGTSVGVISPDKSKEVDDNIATLNKQKTEIIASYNKDTARYDADKDKATKEYAVQKAAIESEQNTLNNTKEIPITQANATKVVNTFDTAVAAQNQAQIELSKQIKIAQENARSNNPGADPNLSSSWSDADKEAVQAKIKKTDDASAAQKDAAAHLVVFAATPGGQDAIAKAGINQEKLQLKLQGNGVDSAQNILLQNNTITGNIGNAVFGSQEVFDKLDASNIRPDNGFEGIKNGAPFYLQMPTLNSLSDFKLKNGISPYGDKSGNEVARDAIHFNIFEVTPPSPRATTQANGLVVNDVETAKSNTLGVFTVYPTNSDYLSFNHSHSYDTSSTIANSINQALGVIDTADTLLSLGSAIGSSSNKSKEQGLNSIVQRRVEAISTYSGTDKQAITINFVLFTKNNFLSDVFKPLMFLTSLSYPKRTLNGNLGLSTQSANNNIQTALQNNPQLGSKIRDLLRASGNAIQDVGQFLDDVENTLGRFGGVGPYRYYVSRRPEYMSIRHASGLFYYPLAYISNVSYSFKGPWYNSDGHPLEQNKGLDVLLAGKVQEAAAKKGFFDSVTDAFKNAFNNTNNTSKTNNPQSTFSKDLQTNGLEGNLQYVIDGKLQYAYPSWAEVSITVNNAMPMFRDDFLQSFYVNDGSALVSVTETQTGFDRSLNLSNGVPQQNAFQ